MDTLCICPTEGLTWDDVCELWDNGVYTAEDIKRIALLYFDGAELFAVLDIVEKVEIESCPLQEVNPDPEDYHPAASETDRDAPSARGKSYLERAWRGLH